MTQHLNEVHNSLDKKENPNSGNSSKGFSDHFLLFFIAAVGFLGSIYLFSYCDSDHEAEQLASITNSPANNSLLVPQKEYNFSRDVSIEGEREVGQKLVFSLNNYQMGSLFMLDFGNGQQKLINQSPVDHVYHHSGTFKLQLKAVKSSKLHTVSSQNIYIKENEKLSLK